MLNKLFGGKESQFQKQVVSYLQSQSADIGKPSDALRIRISGIELNLEALYEKCLANSVQSSELIQQYFSFPLAFALHHNYEWNAAESMIRPQLVPSAIAEPFGILLFPFQETISACVVVREGNHQVFVRKSDPKEWNISPEELFNRAIVNLDADPVEMEVTITDGSDRFIGLESHDGFDAARILLPRVREFAAGKLRLPFLAGLPNRDFLILWSTQCSPRFQEYAIEKIETDFAIQHFPLTTSRFEIGVESITKT